MKQANAFERRQFNNLVDSGGNSQKPNWLGDFNIGDFIKQTVPNVLNNITQKKTGVAADVKAVCGKQPINLGPFNRKKQDEYKVCATNYAAQQAALAAETAKKETEKNNPKSNTGLIIGLSLAALVIGGTIFAVVKHKNKTATTA